MRPSPRWPVLRSYDADHLRRIAMPLGGIGTGTVSLGGRGDLRDWEIVNRPAKGFQPANAFFAIWARRAGRPPVTRMLAGPVDPADYEGDRGCRVANHGLPTFRNVRFDAAYPLAQVHLSDSDVPLSVRLEAFNPLVPGDADASGIPVAVLRYILRNRTNRPVAAAVCGNLQNFIGNDGTTALARRNRNRFRAGHRIRGLFLNSTGVPADAETWGTIALVTTARAGVSHRTSWATLSWGGALLDYWDDFSADGALDGRDLAHQDLPIASLAVRLHVPPHAERSVTFLLAWHFPNRRTWTPAKTGGDPEIVGNHYARRDADAWAVVQRVGPRLSDLEERTVRFVRAFVAADLPGPAKEAALFNLSTLRSHTVFRTADGHLYGWEGCDDRKGCCHGSCTHVWNYENALGFLFGDLSRRMREVEFLHATDARGHMSFRVDVPLSRATGHGLAAADGQMGAIMRAYRDWKLCGDDAWLRRLWPQVRRAMEFCWIAGGWDADRDGVMEGCQHNTMDVEYFGPNPQMTGWYLGALRACELMAAHLGQCDFAATCRDLYTRGSRWMDRHLFNGDYYEHEVRPPAGQASIAPGLRHPSMGSRDLLDPELQLGSGCLVDQLVGQYMAHACGLGHLHAPANIRRTLASIKRHNWRTGFHGHFNQMRSFALGDSAGLLMCSYPRGRRSRRPFPYYNEVMTGFEYVAACGMLYEGMIDEGLECIAAVRERYDGWQRNPFDEAECGHHYARALASWTALLALTGFDYNASSGTMAFAVPTRPVTWFWSTGATWGTVRIKPCGRATTVRLTVWGGRLGLRRLVLRGIGEVTTSLLPASPRPGRP